VNPFVKHHRQGIRLQYSCFDRMLLNAVVQPMQRPALIVGLLDKCKVGTSGNLVDALPWRAG